MAIWHYKYGWRASVDFLKRTYYAPQTFKYKSEARAWCEAEKNRLKEAWSRPTSPGLWELAQRHLDEVQLTLSSKTYYEKRLCLQRFLEAVGDVQPIDITPPQVADFLNARTRQGSANAANKDRKNIKALYKWLQSYYGIMHDPTAPIRQKPHDKKSRRLIPIAEIFQVIMAAPMPERALIAAYWHTGARRGEVLRWSWSEDVNLESRWVRLGTRKNRDGSMQYLRFPMNQDLHELLLSVWKVGARRTHVFPAYFQPNDQGNNWKGEQRAHRLLQKLCTQAGVEPFGYHDIRHTVAKYLNDIQKVGIKKVQQALRHQRQTTTEIYLEGNYTDLSEVARALAFDEVRKISH